MGDDNGNRQVLSGPAADHDSAPPVLAQFSAGLLIGLDGKGMKDCALRIPSAFHSFTAALLFYIYNKQYA